MEAQQPLPDSLKINASPEAFRCKTWWQQANNSFIQHICFCIFCTPENSVDFYKQICEQGQISFCDFGY